MADRSLFVSATSRTGAGLQLRGNRSHRANHDVNAPGAKIPKRVRDVPIGHVRHLQVFHREEGREDELRQARHRRPAILSRLGSYQCDEIGQRRNRNSLRRGNGHRHLGSRSNRDEILGRVEPQVLVLQWDQTVTEPDGANSNVCSSALATNACSPMTLSPPGRLSTTTGVAQRSASRGANSLAVRSLPGARAERYDQPHRLRWPLRRRVLRTRGDCNQRNNGSRRDGCA